MLFYKIPYDYVRLFNRLDAYKDRVVVISWFNIRRGDKVWKHNVSYHITAFNPVHDDLFLYDITDEDMVHLKLLGFPIQRDNLRANDRLEKAVKKRAKIVEQDKPAFLT